MKRQVASCLKRNKDACGAGREERTIVDEATL